MKHYAYSSKSTVYHIMDRGWWTYCDLDLRNYIDGVRVVHSKRPKGRRLCKNCKRQMRCSPTVSEEEE